MTASSRPTLRKLDEAAVRHVLTSSEPSRSLAAIYGVAPQAIRQIRTGETYRDVAPELSRWKRRPGPARKATMPEPPQKIRVTPRRAPKVTERLPVRSCYECLHHAWVPKPGNGRRLDCDLDLPEIRRLGAPAARGCSYFTQARGEGGDG
jgi:hypothetical protein